MDVRESAKKIKTPTLVLQAKDDATVAYEIGRETATYIPGACFVILESNNHVLLSTEPACPHFWSEFYHFLGIETESVAREKQTPDMIYDRILLELSTRERDVLCLLAEGYQNKEIAKKLVLSEKTVRNYISNIYAKLQIKSRGEAIVLARKSGLVDDST